MVIGHRDLSSLPFTSITSTSSHLLHESLGGQSSVDTVVCVINVVSV